MHNLEMINECNELIDKIKLIMYKMGHLVSDTPRCPECGELLDYECNNCKEKQT